MKSEMLRVEEVYDTPEFASAADVIVIGAGIVGTSTAYELARRGVSVALVDKGIVGGEQSGRNWGWVRRQNRDMFELPLAMRSLRRWSELRDEIRIDLGFRRDGILYASNDAKKSPSGTRGASRRARSGLSVICLARPR